MRLFVAVVPPEDVLDRIGEVSEQVRNDDPRVRWTTRAQWHVTLRFLGEVADPQEVIDALATLDPRHFGRVEAELVTEPIVLGRSVLCLPVHGLDELAHAVSGATAPIGAPPEARPFRGHVTVARLRGRSRQRRGFRDIADQRRRPGEAPGEAVGAPLVRWTVNEVQLVRSHLDSDGSRYEALTEVPLGLEHHRKHENPLNGSITSRE